VNRPRKAKGPFPPCFYAKHGAFYLVQKNKWTRLGSDLVLALAEYGRLMQAPKQGGMVKLIDEVMADATPKLAKNTVAQYTYAAAVLKRKLAQFEPGEVRSKHVAAIKQSLAGTPNMANRVISVLRKVFAYAVEQQLVDANPCIGVARLPEAKRPRLLSEEEWSAIHAAAGPRLRIIMQLQYLTGQRISDVLSIRRDQLTDDGIEFEQQKTKARLLVRWSPDLRATVAEAKALSADRPAVTLLRGRFGGAPEYRSVLLQWNEACAAAGVKDARLNDGRAMAATTAKRQGKNAQALLGHVSATMTARYLRDRDTPHVEGPNFRQALDVGQKDK
jgi:integrase